MRDAHYVGVGRWSPRIILKTLQNGAVHSEGCFIYSLGNREEPNA